MLTPEGRSPLLIVFIPSFRHLRVTLLRMWGQKMWGQTGRTQVSVLTDRGNQEPLGGPLKPGFGLSGDVHTSQTRGAGLPLVLIFLALSPKTAAPLFLDFGKGGDIKCFPREILELLTQGAVGKKKSTNSWPQAPTL